jgi:hypothetical protein
LDALDTNTPDPQQHHLVTSLHLPPHNQCVVHTCHGIGQDAALIKGNRVRKMNQVRSWDYSVFGMGTIQFETDSLQVLAQVWAPASTVRAIATNHVNRCDDSITHIEIMHTLAQSLYLSSTLVSQDTR